MLIKLILLSCCVIFSDVFELRFDADKNLTPIGNYPDHHQFIHWPEFDSSRCIQVNLDDYTYNWIIERQCPFNDTIGLRFQFGFDSIRLLDTLKQSRNIPLVRYKILQLTSKVPGITPEGSDFMNLWIEKAMDTFRLVYSISVRPYTKRVLCPIKPMTPYNLELLVPLDRDSTAREAFFRVNGKDFILQDVPEDGLKFFTCSARIGNVSTDYLAHGHFYFDNIATGRGWLFSPPRRPRMDGAADVRSLGDTVRFVSPSFRSFLASSSRRATQYQIRLSEGTWDLPLFDSGADSAGRDSLTIPFISRAGAQYLCRVRHVIDNGITSDWSAAVPLAVNTPARFQNRVLDACFAETGSSRKVLELAKERWYDLVIRPCAPADWPQIAFTVFWANSPSYTLGDQRFRGGVFHAKSNYVYNFSMIPRIVLSKQAENRYPSSIITNTLGAYMDARDTSAIFDSAHGLIRCPVRFPAEADTGTWSLRGFSDYGTGQSTSPLFYGTFRLVPASAVVAKKNRLWPLIPIVLIIIIGVFAVARRKRPAPVPGKPTREEEIVRKFTDYVRQNLDRELGADNIETAMGLGYSSIYKMVKKVTGLHIRRYVLNLRMERARDLFENTNFNISEIMGKVGFNDPSYFAKAFKEHTGRTPRDYRKGEP